MGKAAQGFEAKTIRRIPALREAAERFLALVDASDLAPKTKKYYHNGWAIAGGPGNILDAGFTISEDAISLLRFPGGNSNANNALRTLRRIFGNGVIFREFRKAKLKKEMRREKLLDEVAEAKLNAVPASGAQGHPRDCARYRYAEHI